MKVVKIKVLEGGKDLKGKTLHLEKFKESPWKCKETGIVIIDPQKELDSLNHLDFKNHSLFYDCTFFTLDFDNELQFVKTFKYFRSK